MTRFNILADRLIGVTDDRGSILFATLPQVLARLTRDEVTAFPQLRPHQAHAWHAFLVQLAAMAMERAGMTTLPQDAEAWLPLLRSLTPEYPEDQPWCLLVADWGQPAFLQPPAPSGAERDYRGNFTEPDQIDLLVTAKNHDLKAARMARPDPAHWLFALIALQTMEGFLGAGNYGIARMNGGFSSRPCLGLAPSARPGAHFRRDVMVLLARRDEWFDLGLFARRHDGRTLLWLLPWDGTDQLAVSALDPWFIEVCRRIRLRPEGDGLMAVKAGSKCARIAAAELKGNIGDPWTPVDREGAKALSLTAAGFSYERLQELLFGGNWQRAPLQLPLPGVDDAEALIVARGLARGQGQTAGYHERMLPVSAVVVRRLGQPAECQAMGEVARRHVTDVRELVRHVLWPALLALQDDGDWAASWAGALDRAVDAEFFDRLWPELGAPNPAVTDRAWRRWLCEQAEVLFAQAMAAAPRLSSRGYRVVSRAEGLFHGLLRKNARFADLFVQSREEPA